MTFDQAKDIGLESGLEYPAEWVNHILLHEMNLFMPDQAEIEEAELREDAKRNGVKFSAICNDAILDTDDENKLCYVCRKLTAVGW